MHGESRTAPVSPPPGPLIPALGLLGPSISPQQELVSLLPASSKMIASSPFSVLKAGELMIFGTHVRRKLSAWVSPPGWALARGEACPALNGPGVVTRDVGGL